MEFVRHPSLDSGGLRVKKQRKTQKTRETHFKKSQILVDRRFFFIRRVRPFVSEKKYTPSKVCSRFIRGFHNAIFFFLLFFFFYPQTIQCPRRMTHRLMENLRFHFYFSDISERNNDYSDIRHSSRGRMGLVGGIIFSFWRSLIINPQCRDTFSETMGKGEIGQFGF